LNEASMIPPDQFADLISQATDEQLAEGMASNRDLILQEVFNRWPDEFRADRARDVNAVIEWRITRSEGGEDRWQITIADGACSVARDGDVAEPDVTFTVPPVEFMKLIAGVESGPKLFVFGKLKIRGNLMLAARVQGFFNAPKPGAAAT
jgi:putative sterol carrier protein